MGEVKTPPVEVSLVDSIVARGAPAGAIKYFKTADHDPAGFNFQCPCGCRTMGTVNLSPGGWEWNGSRDKPTVRPSVQLSTHAGPHWHGWLTDGVWRSC